MNAENVKLRMILRERHALLMLRKEIPLSRTEIEVLAYANAESRLFTIYGLKQYYYSTNIQQLRNAVRRLYSEKLLDEIKAGVKNSPATYWLTNRGQNVLMKYLNLM